MDVVFDVNVLISALIIKGKPKELWLKAVRKEFNLVSSMQILTCQYMIINIIFTIKGYVATPMASVSNLFS